MKKYKINSKLSYVKDEASVAFHVESGDYFGTIATIVSLISQDIEDNNCYEPKDVLKALKNLEKDLIYLQENYDINPKRK